MKAITASSVTSKLLVVVVVALLVLNLHDVSFLSPCASQHAQIAAALKSLDACAQLTDILAHIDTWKKSPILQAPSCHSLETIARQLVTLKSCDGEDKILNSLHEINLSLNGDEFLSQLGAIKSSLLTKTNADSLSAVEKLEQLRDELLKHAAVDKEKTKLQRSQREEEERILNEFIPQASRDLDAVKETLKKIESVKFILYNSKLSLLDKVDLNEMSDVLDRRDESKKAIFLVNSVGEEKISVRFVCSVESVAKFNPDADVYVLFANLTSTTLFESENKALFAVIKRYKNIQLLAMDLDKLIRLSPLENLSNVDNIFETTRDLISILPVLLYGGTYLNSEIILARNVTGMKQFVIVDSSGKQISSSAFGFEKNSEMWDLVLEIINETEHRSSFLTELLKRYTGVENVLDLMNFNLKNISKLSYKSLHPLDDSKVRLYFDEARSDVTMKRLQSSHDLYGYSIRDQSTAVRIGSRQPISLIAQKQCPRSYWACKTKF